MGVKIKDRLTPDGEKLLQALKEMAEMKVRVGFQAGTATEENGTDVCEVAAYNEFGTDTIPARPFMRNSVDENEGKIDKMLVDGCKMLIHGAPAEQVLEHIGKTQKDLIQKEIAKGSYEPNAPSTIAKKGSSKPLVDSGLMRQSVNYVVQPKGSSEE